ncbi:MAG: hypothetical protein J3R72DRAFT_167320 [Linnemannia gamsii]|nr:MAG: hypothetical protein J3R72DRAFT_167320 [Linnemannia gamsii]
MHNGGACLEGTYEKKRKRVSASWSVQERSQYFLFPLLMRSFSLCLWLLCCVRTCIRVCSCLRKIRNERLRKLKRIGESERMMAVAIAIVICSPIVNCLIAHCSLNLYARLSTARIAAPHSSF